MKQSPRTTTIDLSASANRGFSGSSMTGSAQSWTNQGDNDIRGLVPGIVKANGVDFSILDPKANRNRSAIVLRNKEEHFARQSIIDIGGGTCSFLYLLHATSLLGSSRSPGTVTFVYAGGDESSIRIRADVDVADWWSGDDIEGASCVFVRDANPIRDTVSLYACALRNPHPSKSIRKIRIDLDGGLSGTATWMIVAATISTGRNLLSIRNRIVIEAKYDVTNGAIRRLHGANIGAPIYLKQMRESINEQLRKLEIPVTRMHDCPWDNAGMKLIDVHQIFPLFHADASDSRNYFFKHTDDFIENCISNGSSVYYRLGTTIEHTTRNYFTDPPKDNRKWSEICANIVRHYNHGWADGFHHNIVYWEIWNEADLGNHMWTGTWEQYIRLYIAVARRLKSEFPNIKIGGPGLVSLNPKYVDPFLDACVKNNTPLDFFSWHKYGSNVETIVKQPVIARETLDRHGFTATEIHLNEWHYSHGPWALSGDDAARNQHEWNGPDSAAYICAVLSGWQDTPLDMGHYYTSSISPLFGMFNAFAQPNMSYFGMLCFSEMSRYRHRFQVQATEGKNVWVLGGRNDEGEAAIMVAYRRGGRKTITIKVEHDGGIRVRNASVRMIDANHRLESVSNFSVSGDTIRLRKPQGSAVFLITMPPGKSAPKRPRRR